DRTALVVGNTCQAFRAVAELQRIAYHVTLVAPTHGDLDLEVARNLDAKHNVTFYDGYEVVEFTGDQYVNAVTLRKDGETMEIRTDCVFIEMDLKPNSRLYKGLVDMDDKGFIHVDVVNRTSYPGLYAAGEVTTAFSDQVLISMGEGAKAILAIYDDLLGIC
ncbi:MAG: NAD(P)/FAD-dependent oxidoreductase, partial [Anaerolineae bacterium]|nr:NAD(P)/FAD-dependent oxidoreductase [Anaerolineae bacterium]